MHPLGIELLHQQMSWAEVPLIFVSLRYGTQKYGACTFFWSFTEKRLCQLSSSSSLISSHAFTQNKFSCLQKAEEKFGRMVNSTDCDSSLLNIQIPSTSCCSLTGNIKMNEDPTSNVKHKFKLNSKLQGHLGLFACYIHPMPISMVQLIVKENEIFTCVKCGYSDHKEDTLFIYKASKNGEKMGSPSLVGYVPITLQISKNAFGRDVR